MMNTPNTTQAGERTQFTSRDIGIILDQSYGDADKLNKRTIQFAQEHGYKADWEAIATADEEDRSQFLSEEADDAVSFLNDCDRPSFCSFYFEDNSLFLAPSVEMAREDVEFVSSRKEEYPPTDYRGEWLHVNDHGNATLYVREAGEDREIWSVV